MLGPIRLTHDVPGVGFGLHPSMFVQDLSQKLGVELRETVVFDYPTLYELAAHLSSISVQRRRGGRWRSSRCGGRSGEWGPDRTGSEACENHHRSARALPGVLSPPRAGDLPTLFCIHPMSGDLGIYVGLAEAAQGKFNVVGLRSSGLFDAGEPRQTVEAMAEAYQRIIREIIPEGPWNLLGSSMGGTVAYETLARLAAHGDATNQLFLLEAPLIEDQAAAEPWQSDTLENLMMNANFLMISMLHLDPGFRQKKAAGGIDWRVGRSPAMNSRWMRKAMRVSLSINWWT